MSKQTAVQKLINDLKHGELSIYNKHHVQKYLDLEKQQIIDAYQQNAWNDNDNEHNAEEYYNETFNQK
jgi:hypothetical protein